MENDPILSGVAPSSSGLSLLMEGDIFLNSFLKHEPQIRAIPGDQIVTLKADALTSVRISLGASRRWAVLRPRMLKLGDELNQQLIDDNVSITYAFAYARAALAEERPGEESLQAASEEGVTLRDKLGLSRELLDKLGIKPSHYVFALSRAPGNTNLANHLLGLVRFYRENWQAIRGKVPIRPEDVKRSAEVARLLMDGVADRDGTPITAAESTVIYQQAATLFQRSYNEVRHGVYFLCGRQGDHEQYAPSLFVRNATRPKEDGSEETPEVAPLAPNTPNVGSPTNAPVAPSNPVPVGHMGSNPFIS